MIGTTLSHFRITAKLGEGGMGEVYRAEDTSLGREVALKVLPADVAEDPERLARFEREAKTLAALDHPNIVHIYTVERADVGDEDSGETRTVRFLTMQLVEGRPLTTVIPSRGLPLAGIFELGIPLTEALAAAHDKGIVHRDLKPDNIMVSDQGRVKVLDFGLAKLQQVGAVVETTAAPTEVLTGEGKILGTMPYMSPEQLEGKDLDARSDIFSLGILLYEMATGKRPFQGDTSVSLISAIVKDTPPSVDTVRDELPHHLARIVNRCLEKDPKRRYQTATDVYHELDGLKREVEAGIVSSGARRPTTAEREAATAATSSAAEAPSPPTAAVPPVPPVQPPSAEPSGATSPAAPAPVRRIPWVGLIPVVVMALLVVYWLNRGERAPPKDVATTVSKAAPSSGSTTGGDDIPAIVVLPFQNRGQSEDEFFADGMSEEITTRLAGISGLRVVSSTSAMQYKENRPALRQIAEELDVDFVLEGSVRWAKSDDGSRVRITPQLVRTADDSQLWAESYDRVLEDVFEMQSEIAAEVVSQLGITLLEPERQELEARPTDNLEAYQAFLRGVHLQNSSDFTEPTRRRAVEDLETAIELDPAFALAWATLSHAHAFYYRLGYDLTESRAQLAKKAYDRALELDPDSPEVQYELGYYHYYIEQDHEAALERFQAAERARPDDAEIKSSIAFVWRRQGKFAEGIERLEEAFALSPRNAQIPALIGEFAQMTREYEKSIEYLDKSIALAPDEYWPYVQKVQTLWLCREDLEEARRILESIPDSASETLLLFLGWTDLSRVERDFDRMLAVQEEATSEWYTHQTMTIPKRLVIAEALSFKGDREGARSEYQVALEMLDAALIERPEDYRLHSSRGVTLAGLGRRNEAIAAGKRAIELMPVEKDVYIGSQFVYDMALIYATLGDAEEALEQIDQLLSMPAKFSVTMLQQDPRWDSLRDYPRYRELIDKYS